METQECNLKSRLAKDVRYKCNEETGEYELIRPRKCSKSSRYKNDPRYYCDHATGIFKLHKDYERVYVEGAPKRPKSSYMLWVTEPGVRDKIKELLQDEDTPITFQSVGRKFGEIWNDGEWPDGESIDKEYYKKVATIAQKKYKKLAAAFKGDSPRKPFTIIRKKDKKHQYPTIYNKFYHDYRIKLLKKRPILGKKGHGRELNELITSEWAKKQVQEKARVKYAKERKPRTRHRNIVQPSQTTQPQEVEQ